jgi:hypothetical protein
VATTNATETQSAIPPEHEPAVHHPKHYNEGKYEVIDVIEDWKLTFNTGNTIKYIARARHKGDETQDLQKAWWYLTRELLRVSPTIEPLRQMLDTMFKAK